MTRYDPVSIRFEHTQWQLKEVLRSAKHQNTHPDPAASIVQE